MEQLLTALPELPCLDSSASTAMSVLIRHDVPMEIEDRLGYECRDRSAPIGALPTVIRQRPMRRAPERATPAHAGNDELRQHDAFEGAQRIASGRFTASDQMWLSKAFTAFLAAGGSLPLERCLGLPRNDYTLRRACRDYWLRSAWKSLANLSPWRRSEKLAAAIRDFRTRHWVRWRTLDDPPTHASTLEAALFQAFRSSERIPSTAMQLHNIAYHRRHS